MEGDLPVAGFACFVESGKLIRRYCNTTYCCTLLWHFLKPIKPNDTFILRTLSTNLFLLLPLCALTLGMLCKSTPAHSCSWMCYPLRLKTIRGTLDVIHDSLIEIIRIILHWYYLCFWLLCLWRYSNSLISTCNTYMCKDMSGHQHSQRCIELIVCL